MDQDEFRARWEHSKALNIRFLGPVPPSDWPRAHRSLFEDIQKLGDQKYSTFSESVSVDSIEKPWRRQTKQRAARLVARSRMSRNDRRNEAGWRLTIEPEVLYRFTVEVTCPRCRSRLWQSEIEAAVQSSEPFAESLENRRQKRQPCQCIDRWGYTSGYEYGINMLFSDRAQAAIKHKEPIPIRAKRKNDQASEEPDRVYGLRETESFRKVLDSIDRRDASDGNLKRLRETVEACPFHDESDKLLFPFLILEAKSGKNGDLAAVEMQSCFSIRRLLKLQYDLHDADGNRPGSIDPLVWFLVCMGERWVVEGCFVNAKGDSVEWVIVNLWSGDIQSEDGSLQLLLIIDYIFDWARDVYRESLLAALRNLAVEEHTSIDPDIFSNVGRESTVRTLPSTAVDSIPHPITSSDEFLNLIHPQGVVRDASVIESRFLALCLTETDVDQFMLSFNSHGMFRDTVLAMANALEGSWWLTAETMAGIEESWTGKSRAALRDVGPETLFYVKINLFMFISVDWQPVRQFSCLALTEEAMTKLYGDLARNLYRTPITPTLTIAAMQKIISRLRNQSIVDNLTAATSMQCLSSTLCPHAGGMEPQFRVKNTRPFAGFMADGSPSILEYMLPVFESHRVGQRFSPDLYLRFSSFRNRQSPHTKGTKMWPQLQQLALHKNGCVLIEGVQHGADSPPCCLYIVDGVYHPEEAGSLVEQVSSQGYYYSTFLVGQGNDPGVYFNYLNTALHEDRIWKAEQHGGQFQTWIRALQDSPLRDIPVRGSLSRPISISSSEEQWDEGSKSQIRAMTVAWKAEG
ncbi:hypothetical protein BDW62DRAFT_179704 [Aspergillus aurantiobrunneus]